MILQSKNKEMNSKKLLTTLFAAVIFILIIGNSNAQLLNLSVKGGLNLSDISGNYTTPTDMKAGFNIYLSKDFLNLLIVTLSGEAGYTQKGFEMEIVTTNKFGEFAGRHEIHAKLNYIDLSVLGKLRIPGGIVFPYFLAGPSLGIKTNSSVKTSDNSTFPDLENTLEDFSSTSFGFKFGLGMEFGLPLLSVLAEARYNPDITASYDKNNLKLKNKVFEFLVGVKF